MLEGPATQPSNLNMAIGQTGRPVWHELVDAIEQLSGARNFARIVDIVKQAARRISGADGVTVVLREGDLCYYMDEDAIGPLWKGHRFPMRSCISGWAMMHKQSVVVPDIYADARIPHDAYRPTFVKSLLMTPIRVEDPLAAIGTYWATQYTPSDEEVALLQSLARATATAIANVNLETSLRDMAATAQNQAEEISRAYKEAQKNAAKQRNTEELLRQAQKMEAVGQLTGGIAHDFNNILAVIVGNLDSLIDRMQSAPSRDLIPLAEEAVASALRGSDLTKQLLMFARRTQLEPVPTDIVRLLKDATTMLGRMLGDQIEISVDAAADLWKCMADPNQVETALLNLAINARDAMPDGGALKFEARNVHLDAAYALDRQEVAPGDYVKISVSDNGSGMPPEVLERVFEPFFTTKKPGQGTGLGLSMVYGFAKQSSGHLAIYSELGLGTTVNLYLPRSLVDVATETRKDDGFPLSQIGHETVLVVDDQDAVRRTAVMALKDLGYRVVEAKDAGEAIDILAKKTQIDLVFSDIAMPGGLSGFDLAKHVLHNHPQTKVMLVTGFAEGAARDHGNVPPQVKLITKPYRRHELAKSLRDVLDRPRK